MFLGGNPSQEIEDGMGVCIYAECGKCRANKRTLAQYFVRCRSCLVSVGACGVYDARQSGQGKR